MMINEDKTIHTPLKLHYLIGYLIILSLFTINIFRAHTQSVTHDEALTYRNYASEGWKKTLLSFESNNHTFHSSLMKISTSLFGLSHLSMRLPALLGGLLYLASVERFCRVFCKRKLNYVLSLSAATTSPFILDYLVVARGYSLALGFLMTAILLCAKELFKSDGEDAREKEFSRYFKISSLSALSVASNLSFAFVNISLLVVFLTWTWLSKGFAQKKKFSLKSISYDLLSLVIPGAVLFVVLNPAVINFNNKKLYFGVQTWSATYRSTINATFDGSSVGALGIIRPDFLIWIVDLLPLLLSLCILFGGIFVLRAIVRRYSKHENIEAKFKLWLFLFAILAVTISFQSFAHRWFGVLLPKERTGIFFVPISILLVSISIETFRDGFFQLLLRYMGYLGLLFVVIQFISSVRLNYFRNWKYDAGSKDVYLVLRSLDWDHIDSDVGINWLLEPSLNYYRTFYSDNYLPPFTREEPTINQEIFVLLPDSSDEDTRFLQEYNLRVHFQHPISGAIIAIRE